MYGHLSVVPILLCLSLLLNTSIVSSSPEHVTMRSLLDSGYVIDHVVPLPDALATGSLFSEAVITRVILSYDRWYTFYKTDYWVCDFNGVEEDRMSVCLQMM